MSTDAIVFNRNGSSASNRMDRMQNQNKFDSDMGFGDTAKSRFKETYAQIARNNNDAKQLDDSSVNNRSIRRDTDSKKASDRDSVDNRDIDNVDSSEQDQYRKVQNVSDSEDYEDENGEKDENESKKSEQAAEIIKQSLIDISDILQLNLAPGLDQVSFDSIQEETVDQFAQIVHNLKSIISALEVSVSQDQPIDTGNKVIESKEASTMLSKLQAELFRIEIGINMLGVSEDVQNQLAGKMDIPFSSGIPQATDPAQLSMPIEQAKKIFDGVFSTAEDSSSISQLASKLNQLVKESATENPPCNVITVSNDKQQIAEITPFTAQTFRAMLKIESKEKMEKVSVENTEAAEKSGKVDIPESANGVLAKELTSHESKLSEQVIAINEITAKTHHNQQNILQDIRTPANLSKTLEESIVNQVNNKIQAAIRTGATEIRIQLRPESLGDVSVKIRIEGDVVTAKMQVENQQVKAIIENNFQSLKDALAQHNLQTGSLEVNVQTGGKHEGYQGESANQFTSNNNSTGSGTGDQAESSEELASGDVSGTETGRRFGNNTVEYFA